MPKPPRLETESARRIAIAVVMALVLGASTAGGIWLGRARSVTDLTQQDMGWFGLQRPQSWERLAQRVSDDSGITLLGEYLDRGPREQKLTVYQYISAVPVGPELALTQVLDRALLRAIEPEPLTFGPLTGAWGEVGISLDAGDYHQATAILTLDGTHHVVLVVNSSLMHAEANRLLLQRIVETVRDKRYEPATAPLELAHGRIETLPPSLHLLQRAGRDGARELLAVPRTRGAFVAVRATPVDLRETATTLARMLPASDEAADSRLVPPLLAELAGGRALTPQDRMDLALVWRYWLARNEPPPRTAISDPTFEGHAMRALAISPRGAATYRLAWVLRLDDESAVLLEATASPDAAWPARQTAQLMAHTLIAPAAAQPVER